MKKTLFIAFISIMAMPMTMFGQSYKNMWKQLEEAVQKDLPQQVIQKAEQITQKARKEREYGHLLKAQLMMMGMQSSVSPDSLQPAVSRLERDLQATQDGALRAVYAAVLSRIYSENPMMYGDSANRASAKYRDMALENPALLADTKASKFEPMVLKGADSRYFNHDLLSLVGSTLEQYSQMHAEYVRRGNRPAACLSALWEMRQQRSYSYSWENAPYIHRLDSLIKEYGDLDISAELALERYDYMTTRTGASEGERLRYIHEALARWPKWPRMNELRNAEQEMTNPKFSVRMDREVQRTVGSQDVCLYDMRNISQLTFKVYRTQLDGTTRLDPSDEDDYDEMKPHLTLLADRTQTCAYHINENEDENENGNENETLRYENENRKRYAPYEEFEDTLTVGPLPQGVYMLEWTGVVANSSKGETMTVRRLLYVSDLYLLSEAMPGNRMRYVVVNSQSGQPVGGARLRLLGDRDNTTIMETACDAKGECVVNMFKYPKARIAYAFTDTDRSYCPTRTYGQFDYSEGRADRVETNIFTDRSIYRPGQTVHAAVLVYQVDDHIDTRAAEGRKVTLVLRNANYKTVEEKEATTDKYGKASAEFVLPVGQLNGRYTIECNNERHSFRVEDYKRPTYEVTFDEVKTTYKAGDTLAVKGQARSYAGVGVQGAHVTYSVKRRISYWWLSYSWYWDQGAFGRGYGDETLASGEQETDAAGQFTVDVPLVLPDGIDPKRPMFYQYVIEASVTDQAGESHEGFTSIPLGTRPQVLTCDLPEQLLKEEQKPLTFHLRNSAGNDIEGKTVRFRLDGGEWQEVKTNSQFSILNSQLQSGRHTLEAICEGDTLEQKVTIFSLDDTKPCTETPEWFYTSASRFPNDGTPVTVQVGSSDDDCHVVYCIIADDKVLEQGAFDQSNALWNKKFTYQEQYGKGLLLSFAWVKDDKLHAYQTTIERPVPDKRLTVRWETFRDRLTPGQKEEWKLVVNNPDGTPADAQVMATMYDKSLDQLYSHRWAFAPAIYLPHPNTIWNGSHWGDLRACQRYDWDRLEVKRMRFSRFDFDVAHGLVGYYWWYGDDFLEEVVVVGYGTAKRRSLQRVDLDEGPVLYEMASAPMEDAMQAKVTTNNAADDEADDDADDGGTAVQMRENLNETAFFYPTLTTDQDGRTVIKFTLPESLTTWRFMGIATTQDMKSGYIDGEAVAQKEVMVQPNMPRFLRAGDQAQLTTRIFNTSDHQVSGTAMLRLLDPETNKVVLKQSQPFTVKAGETAVATFDIALSTINTQLSTIYICQVSASGKTFSDGEQHYLAVLPNVERVTRTVPFTQHEPGTTKIDLTHLFPSGTVADSKLTVEYTNNPVWLMVQALPSVGNPDENNAIDQAAWLYSNLIARTLVGQSDNIRQVFNRWKLESADDGSLTAQLAKNQELKDILLQETPWVADADRETEQKLRLADFFDENTMGNRIDEATRKLRDLQNGDGSWSWWPGMKGSFYMTVSISEMLTRLNVMTGKQQATASMLDNAFRFMGKEMVEEVEEMKKWEKKHGQDYGFPSFKALQYLYICALDGRTLPKDVRKANDYLIGKMKKDIKNQSIYEKALSAIILSKTGEKKRSLEYAQSLKEYTVFTEEKGRYYDTGRAYYSWYDYKIPTEVMAIEALKVITPEDGQTIEEMQRWLLQEKRTQAWDTPINSVNAVYAFLFDNTQLLDAQEQTVLAIDGKPIQLPKATAGIGYVKTAISQPKGREFTAKKTSTGTSWGALYAQFMQPVSDIEASASGLTIKREIFVSGGTAEANSSLFTLHSSLKVGDKVKVRLTIVSERDLDFVQVLDRRAACMEPVSQLSGYRNGAYCSPKDYSTNYYFDMLPKGKRVIETEYYIDRAGTYETGTCTIQCAYSPEYRATAPSMTIKVKE